MTRTQFFVSTEIIITQKLKIENEYFLKFVTIVGMPSLMVIFLEQLCPRGRVHLGLTLCGASTHERPDHNTGDFPLLFISVWDL